MPITDYQLLIDKELQYGEIATTDKAQIWTFINNTKVIIPMGFGVVADSGTDKGVKLPSANTDVVEGISYFSDLWEQREGYSIDTNGYYGYPAENTISVVRYGLICVPVDKAMTRNSSIQLRVGTSATNTSAIAGTFTSGAADTDAITLKAKVYQSCSAPAANKLSKCTIELKLIE